MLRSVLVAAFSALVAAGALSGFSGAKDEVRANTSWPAIVASPMGEDNTSWPIAPADGAGS
ncbi:hypothetical protein AB0F77_28040 [Streptomyces sp. NPDC026672]|uniref:hypothetical protein n=1 Tax=unclassified Streptomyces TaxID=2593676 RepID=UPI00340D7B88